MRAIGPKSTAVQDSDGFGAQAPMKAIGPKGLSALGPKSGASGDEFGYGFDPNSTPSWSQWHELDLAPVAAHDPDKDQEWKSILPPPGPDAKMAINPLPAYKSSPDNNPIDVALQVDDMLGGLSEKVSHVAVNAGDEGLPEEMMKSTDDM